MQAPLAFRPGTLDAHRDLGAMAGLPGHRDDLHRPVGDLRDLQREQLAHQVGVGAGQRDQRLTGPARHTDHIATHPVAVLVALAGHLFGGRDHPFGGLGLAAHPDDDQTAGVGPAVALDDARDDLALAGGELAVGALVLGVAETLQHHLTCGGRGDPAETLGSVVPFADDVAVLVHLAGDHLNDTGLAIDLDARVGLVTLGVPVGGQQRGLDRFEQLVDRDAPIDLDRMQRGHVDVHVPASVPADLTRQFQLRLALAAKTQPGQQLSQFRRAGSRAPPSPGRRGPPARSRHRASRRPDRSAAIRPPAPARPCGRGRGGSASHWSAGVRHRAN